MENEEKQYVEMIYGEKQQNECISCKMYECLVHDDYIEDDLSEDTFLNNLCKKLREENYKINKKN